MKKLFFVSGIAITLLLQGFILLPAYAQTATAVAMRQPAYCLQFGYLYRGLSDYRTGGQVSALQQFLSTQGYYQPVTGYFGSITASNVAAFQRAQGLYPITGGVGPLTRAAIARLCGGNSGGGQTTGLSAAPNSGMAPLTVTFAVSQTPGGYWAIQFGDGQSANSLQGSISHTYTQPGTYTATAMSDLPCLHTTPQCYTLVAQQLLGTATITVTGQQTVGGLTVTSPKAGENYARGSTMQISWSYPVTPGSADIVLSLYTAAGAKIGVIAISNNTIGGYSWRVPPFPNNMMCTMQYPNALCGTNIVPGQYYIEADAVTAGQGLNTSAPIIASGQSGIVNIY